MFVKKYEIYTEKEVLMRGYRVIIPLKLKKQLLEEIYSIHMGVVKLKVLAKQELWWANLDTKIVLSKIVVVYV